MAVIDSAVHLSTVPRNGTSHGLLRLMLRRRPSAELWLFFMCQFLAVAIVTGILMFTDRIQGAIHSESAKMMAADLLVDASRPAPEEWRNKAAQFNVAEVRSARFPSMLFYQDQLQLTDIRVVSSGYPLRGDLTARTGRDQPTLRQNDKRDGLPAPGEIWLDQRSAQTLNASVGSGIEVGERVLVFSKILVEEPGSALPSIGFSGRALMRVEDLQSTALVQPGSRVSYQWMLAGEESDLQAFRQWLEPQLSIHESLQTAREGDERTAQILERAASFLSLGGAIAVLLAGIAAMIAAARYMAGQQDNVAIMRALGASRRQLLLAYLSQFLLFTLAALLLGYLVGFSIQSAGFYLIRSWLEVPAGFDWRALIAGSVTALFCLLCFALPTLTSLVKVSPMRLLRSISSNQPQGSGVIWFALGFLLLMFFYSGSWQSTIIVYGGIVLLAGSVWLLSGQLARLLTYISESRHSAVTSASGRAFAMGVKAFCRQPQSNQLRTAALAMTITLLVVISALRTVLLDQWQSQLPADAPNYFALNVSEQDVNGFDQQLKDAGFRVEPMYAVARARLIAINHLSFPDWGVTNPDALASLEREMVLTQIADLPNGNEIIDGRWHGDRAAVGETESVREVSVEQSIAERLKISLDDKLHFSFAGQEVVAVVTSIRQLDWNTMQPNFYFIFSPPHLTAFPYTYMTSFHAQTDNAGEVVDTINRAFPTVSLIDIGLMVERAQGILSRVSLAVEAVAWVTVVAGLLVVIASLRSTLDTRLQEQTIARALGASALLLRRTLRVELAVTGLLAGVTGLVAGWLIVYALGRWVFDMSLYVPWFIALAVPLAAMLVVMVTGFWVLRQVHRQSPLAIWRGRA